MRDNAPTPTEIVKLADQAAQDFSRVRALFKEDEALYELQFKESLGLPDEYQGQGVVLPTARSNVDTFADYIDISNATVKVGRRGEKEVDRESAEQMIKFGTGLIWMTNVQGVVSPWRVVAKHYPLHGLGIFKTVFSADRWPDRPRRKPKESEESFATRLQDWNNEAEGSMPILITAVNPQCLLFDTATMGEDWCIETYEKKLRDVVRRYKNWDNPLEKAEKETVTYIDYWDRDYRCVLLDGQPVLKSKDGVAEHGYGFVPYTLMDAGLGNVDAANALETRFVGINRYLRDVLFSQSRDYSLVDIIVAENGMPPGVLVGELAKTVGKLDLTYGTYTALPVGVDIKTILPTMTPDQVTQHFQISCDIIEGYAMPRSLRGQGEVGVRSGADRRQILAAAQYRLRYSEMAFKNRTSDVLNKAARILMRVVPGNITVFSHTPADEFEDVIDKKKIREPINYFVTFAPVSEEDEYRRHDDIERMLTTGLATKEWGRRQISTMNPKDLHRQELMEACRNSPAYMNMINQLIEVKAREAVVTRLGAEALASQPPQGGPPMPQPGMPPGAPGGAPGAPMGPQAMPAQGLMPNQAGMTSPMRQVAPAGSAAALQTQMEGMRSQTPLNPMQGRGGGGARGAQR